MKITDIRLHLVCPQGREEIIAGTRLGWVFVEIHTDEGLTGIGECTNFPRRGNHIVARVLESVRQDLIGRDPSRIEAIWNDLFRAYTYLGSRGPITTIISGIDIALWDLKGKSLGRPIHDLLGGKVRDQILLYSHPGGDTPDTAAVASKQLVAQGFTALKTDPFKEVAPRHTNYQGGQISRPGIIAGAQIVAAIREAVGPEIEILIDAHGHYNAATAVECIQALEPYGISWFEEPVPPEGIAALRAIRRQTDTPLCAGERLFTRWEFQPILDEGLVNYVMPDVCWTGGISELRKIAAMAETYLIPVTPHNSLGPIQILAGGHTMLTIPNFYRLEVQSLWVDAWYNPFIHPALDIRNGNLHLSDAPGLGVELNYDAIREHADPDW